MSIPFLKLKLMGQHLFKMVLGRNMFDYIYTFTLVLGGCIWYRLEVPTIRCSMKLSSDLTLLRCLRGRAVLLSQVSRMLSALAHWLQDSISFDRNKDPGQNWETGESYRITKFFNLECSTSLIGKSKQNVCVRPKSPVENIRPTKSLLVIAQTLTLCFAHHGFFLKHLVDVILPSSFQSFLPST